MLDARRDAEAEDAPGLAAVQPQKPPLHTAAVRQMRHVQQDEDCRQALRNDARQCHAVGGHLADDDEEQVQNHVQNASRRQIGQRPLCVAAGAQDSVAEVENAECRHAERIDAEIEHRAGQQIVLRFQQLQHRCSQEKA